MVDKVLTAVVVLMTGGVLAAPVSTPQPAAIGPKAKAVLAKIAVPKGVCVVLGLPAGRPGKLRHGPGRGKRVPGLFPVAQGRGRGGGAKSGPGRRAAGQAGLRRSRPVAADPPGRQPGRPGLGVASRRSKGAAGGSAARAAPRGQGTLRPEGSRQAACRRASMPGATPITAPTTTRSPRIRSRWCPA